MQTIDSLAFEVVKRYAPHLGLEQPVVPDAVHRGHPSFKDIRGMARRLLESAPAVAEGLAGATPSSLSTSTRTPRTTSTLSSPPSRRARHASPLLRRPAAIHLRLRWRRRRVGLAMRAARVGDARVAHRWNENAELRDWLFSARRALLAAEPIDLRDRPRCVHVHEWSGEPPGINRKGHCPAVCGAASSAAASCSQRDPRLRERSWARSGRATR